MKGGQGLFQSVKLMAPKVSKFDLSHERKFSAKMGRIYPVALEEVVPGDRFQWSLESFLRTAPLIAPMMHRVDVRFDAFYIPYRLIWEEFEEFRTGGLDGEASPVLPRFQVDNVGGPGRLPSVPEGGLLDHLGLPPHAGTAFSQQFNALPVRAYWQVYNDYFIDRNNATDVFPTGAIDFLKGSAGISNDDYLRLEDNDGLLQGTWEKDYFTSALKEPQRGAPVGIPLTGTVSVDYKVPAIVTDGTIAAGTGDVTVALGNLQAPIPVIGVADATIDNIQGINLSSISVLVEELRIASRLQEFLERMSIGGSRYTEYLLTIFGVKSSDARMHRSEYLGGMRGKVVISEVLSTVEVDSGPPQGNMAGHGVSVAGRRIFKRFFEEDGLIMITMQVRPRSAYQNGVHPLWKRFDRLDWYIPQFAQLGEQAIRNGELFYDYTQDEAINEAVWGYQSRFAEFKTRLSSVHGEFRTGLAFWHMGRIFSGLPGLNFDFTSTTDPDLFDSPRIFNVIDQSVDNLYIQIFHSVMALRPMPYYNVPKL